MEAELREKYDAEVELIPGSGGVYEIEVDGKEIFSKSKLKRFPEEEEIENLISNST